MRLVPEDRFHLAGSGPPAAALVTPTADSERVTATIYVRRDPSAARAPAVLEQARRLPAGRTYLSVDQAARIYGAAPEDLAKVVAFAAGHGLEVIEQSAARRSVRVAGPASAMNRAFGVHLHTCRHSDGTTFRGYDSEITLPTSLTGVVEGILGLDNRRMARSHLRTADPGPPQADGSLAPNTYLPTTLAKWFDFPSAATGSGECVAVLAFNGTVMETGESTKGGYDPAALARYFTQTIGQPAPKLVDVVVQGPGNDPGDGSDPDDATGEVLLDLCVVGSVAPAATIAVYFTEFTEEGWVNAIKRILTDTANAPSVASISYGNPEDDATGSLWSQAALDLVADAFQQAAAQGLTICVASGDNGAGDEPNATTDHVDFPASSPWVLGCGGTRLEVSAPTDSITSETTWNDLADGHGATGGGVSRLFPLPDWQDSAGVPANADGSGKTGRGVPDVASLADPETPLWVLDPAGGLGGVGGTSAAAPMWAALIARINEGAGRRSGFLNPVLYAQLSPALVDITTGSNGGYQAGPGWDACTGWGRPDGTKLLSAIGAGTTSTPPAAASGPPPGAASTPGPATPPVAASPSPATPYAATFVGPRGQLFADPSPGGDEVSFQVDNTSAAYYDSPYYKLHQRQLQPVPAPTATPPVIDLADIVGARALASITAAKRISFHAVGDTGAAQPGSIANEASVADAMAAAVNGPIGPDTPAFFFHLGDVIYNFGEGQYYYDQLYEPFRAYNRPIIAIPGNHDGSVFGPGTDTPQIPTLTAFLRNFCATSPGPSPDGGSAVRTTMDQPGVYFTLDAPCVSIIGLYSNVLEGPGVISSEGGRYPIGDEQLQFLASELERLKPARQSLERAVVLAVHHPPASADATHGGTLGLSNDIDAACGQAGLWPDVILSGHAHLYQRFTRAVAGTDLPYIVSGSGGYGLLRPQAGLGAGTTTVGEFTLVAPPVYEYGYLTVSVDLAGAPPTLTVDFVTTAGGPQQQDSVTLDLSRRVIM